MDKGLLCRGGGLFFVFEGGDGVGTTTQCQRLRRELESRGHDVLLTREPGGTLISERIRSLVLDKDLKYMSDLTELFLYAAARAQHVQETIVPALAKNQIVICDRFVASSVAYQAYGRGIDIETVNRVNSIAVGNCMPDVTFYLHTSIEEASRRRSGRSNRLDRIEGEGDIFQKRVFDAYLEIAKSDSKGFEVDSAKNIEVTAKNVFNHVLDCWPELRGSKEIS